MRQNSLTRVALVGGLLALGLFAVLAWSERETPSVQAESDFVAVEAGSLFSCGLTTDGGVQCWGVNGYGELGDGTTTTRYTPDFVTGLESGVVAIAAGGRHACAITTSGGLKCWGYDVVGQVGAGYVCADYRCTTPLDVTGLSSGVAAVEAGNEFTCAVMTAGGVKCWGENYIGQLGVGTNSGPEECDLGIPIIFPCATTPVDVPDLSSGVASIAMGGEHACAVTTSGGIKCWGRNTEGQLGLGTTSGPETCFLTETQGDEACSTSPADVPGLTSGVAAAAAGIEHSCALTSGGGVKCWGYSQYGQVGDGSTALRTSPVDVDGLTSGVDDVTSGDQVACAITTEGGLKCWGRNHIAMIGDGTLTDRHTPVDVSGLTSGVTVASGGATHTCAVVSGIAKCWGARTGLGIGPTAPDTCPVGPDNVPCAKTPVTVGEVLPTPTPAPVTPSQTPTPTPTPTPKNPDADTDGDGIPNWQDEDDDNDGCLDTRESGLDEKLGGRRDAHDPWDFYDVSGLTPGKPDGMIDLLSDVLGVINHFAPSGTEQQYDTHYDRGPSPGPHPWNMTAPDGSIDLLVDVLGVIAQFGHDCR